LGCSNYYGEDIQRLTSIGTKPYWSPELLSGDGQDDRLDVWCLGVILY
jgi:serine/threonine protein kinase